MEEVGAQPARRDGNDRDIGVQEESSRNVAKHVLVGQVTTGLHEGHDAPPRAIELSQGKLAAARNPRQFASGLAGAPGEVNCLSDASSRQQPPTPPRLLARHGAPKLTHLSGHRRPRA